MKCKHCGISYSKKVMDIHVERCPERNKEIIEEANNITLEKASKTDLVVFIKSESNTDLTETELMKLKRVELYDMALEIQEK